jgi:thiamine biosynthesis lipoprotein
LRSLLLCAIAMALNTTIGPALAIDSARHVSPPQTQASAERRSLPRFEFTQPHMGTSARIVLHAPDADTARRAADAGFDRIRQLDAALSDYRDDSELNRLAAHAGRGPIPIGDDLFAVLQAAQALARRSGGAFDVTRGAVTRLWRQARKLDEAPDPARLEAASAAGNWRDLRLDPDARTATLTRPGLRLDLGGIAKGYAAEQALRAVQDAGAPSALVALGGDIAVGASPPDANGWRVDVAALDVPGAPSGPSLLLHDAAVSTAGDAEQWMDVGGVRYSHVLDARSGRPLDFRSTTTVIARRGLQADGLDTAASVLGAEAGLRLVDAVPGAAMLMVRQTADGHVQRTASANWPAPDSSAASAALETSP